jgi:hypothetical protein
MISSIRGNLKRDQDLDKAAKSPVSSSTVSELLVHLLQYALSFFFCEEHVHIGMFFQSCNIVVTCNLIV